MWEAPPQKKNNASGASMAAGATNKLFCIWHQEVWTKNQTNYIEK